MNVSVENNGGCRRTVSVDVPAADVAGDYSALLSNYTRQARLPGFRQGKAPSALVEKRFSPQLVEDAKERLIPRFYQEAIAKEELKAVALLGVSDVTFAKDDGLTFKVAIDVVPDFKLPKYEKLTIEGSEAAVTDADVDKAIDDLRGRFARYEDIEGRGIEAQDLVQIDYEGQCDGASLSESIESCQDLGTGKDFWVPVDEPEFLPGFNEAILGAEIGTTRTMDVTFPKDYHIADVAGKSTTYEIAVKAIRTRELPALDENFFKQLQVEDEEALRKMVRENLEEGAQGAEDARRRDNVAKKLLAKSKFDVPESIVEQERNGILRDMVQRAAQQGLGREAMEEQREQMVSSANDMAVQRVRLTYILDAIAAQEKIEVSQDDIDARIEELAARYQMPVERFRSEMGKREGALEGVGNELRASKVIELILDRAKLKIS